MYELIATRYGCTPGQARREPVSTLRHMRLLGIQPEEVKAPPQRTDLPPEDLGLGELSSTLAMENS